LPGSSVGDKGQIRRASQDTGSDAVEEAENAEDENGVAGPNHERASTRGEDSRDEVRNNEENVEGDGLHGVEPDVAGEGRVSHDAEVEGEESDEGGVGDGSVEGEEGDDGIEEDGELRVLRQEVTAVLEGVEEREGVGGDGDEALRRRRRRGVRQARPDGAVFGFEFEREKGFVSGK